MANNYFQFKQFTVQQDQCAMKVCTDACLFGALVAHKIADKKLHHILDIGTGTGLLSLILAQKNNAAIDAVEIDLNAYEQAKENFAASPWAERINSHHTDISRFSPAQQYDWIITNPPFFEDDLRSADHKKNAAKHDTTLTLPVLVQQAKQLLRENGNFAILLPYHRVDHFIREGLAHNLYCNEKVLVKQTPTHQYFRGMLLFSTNKTEPITSEIIIKDKSGNYTQDFALLLQAYYLYL